MGTVTKTGVQSTMAVPPSSDCSACVSPIKTPLERKTTKIFVLLGGFAFLTFSSVLTHFVGTGERPYSLLTSPIYPMHFLTSAIAFAVICLLIHIFSQLKRNNILVQLLKRHSADSGKIWSWQIDNKGAILSCCEVFAELHPGAFDKSQIIGHTPWQIFGSNDQSRRNLLRKWQPLLSAITRGNGFQNFKVPVSLQGKTRWWRLSGAPLISFFGTTTGYCIIGQDVTSLIYTCDEFLEKSARLTEENRCTTDFMAKMSAELLDRTDALTGYLQILQHGHIEHSGLNQRKLLLRNAARSMSKLRNAIAEISTLARLSCPEVVLIEQDVDLIEITKYSISRLRDQKDEQNENPTINICNRLPSGKNIVTGDLARLKMMLVKVLQFATDTPASENPVEIEFSLIQNLPMIEVRFQRQLPAPRELDCLLDPLRRTDRQNIGKLVSLNLDIAIAQKIARVHGGDLTITAPRNADAQYKSRIRIYFPETRLT